MKKFGFTEIVIINTVVFATIVVTIILLVITISMMHDIYSAINIRAIFT